MDTGPLFCLGASTLIAELYDSHYRDDAVVVAAVKHEVQRNAERRVPPGDPARKGFVTQAAKASQRRYALLLARAVPRPEPTPQALTDIEAHLLQLALNKSRNGRVHPDANRGEAESLYEAEFHGTTLIANEDDAVRVAKARRNAPVENFVDVVRRLRHERHTVSPQQLVNELTRLTRQGIDIGDTVTGVTDLV
ncbi:hypothetical protein [Clavibacter californiensis]|uniref:Uncharacterized protein n=1 Tax=Clavibacter californiensis TaxID=1401995 RepID=A0ABX9NCM8_9MICO|nr:hypothetical protein [Clavibacter californiensis]RII94877.1 hypothetical protein DZF98_00190 [Clavibacter californiensis]UKF81705.1 hypothetical protein FGD68_15190 [Clavibacter californiensis]